MPHRCHSWMQIAAYGLDKSFTPRFMKLYGAGQAIMYLTER